MNNLNQYRSEFDKDLDIYSEFDGQTNIEHYAENLVKSEPINIEIELGKYLDLFEAALLTMQQFLINYNKIITTRKNMPEKSNKFNIIINIDQSFAKQISTLFTVGDSLTNALSEIMNNFSRFMHEFYTSYAKLKNNNRLKPKL